jgi:fatty acid-binding protein DegV
MKKYVIVADVTCDLNENIRKRFDIEYIKGHMTLPNGEERQTTLDWSLMKKEDFYNSLKDKKNVYTTAPANIDECKEAFINYIKQGYDILSISISSGLSGTYNFACKRRSS